MTVLLFHIFAASNFSQFTKFTDFYWFCALVVTPYFLYAYSFPQCSFTSRPPPTSYFYPVTRDRHTITCTHRHAVCMHDAHKRPDLNRMSQSTPRWTWAAKWTGESDAGEDGGSNIQTLWLCIHLCQFTKSARKTITVHAVNVKTSLTPIKFSQGHSECMLMLAWDQTSPIKCDLEQEGVWGSGRMAGMAGILCKQPA